MIFHRRRQFVDLVFSQNDVDNRDKAYLYTCNQISIHKGMMPVDNTLGMDVGET